HTFRVTTVTSRPTQSLLCRRGKDHRAEEIAPSFFSSSADTRDLRSFPTRRSSDLTFALGAPDPEAARLLDAAAGSVGELQRLARSEEHTSELQSRGHLVCRLLLEKKIAVIPS